MSIEVGAGAVAARLTVLCDNHAVACGVVAAHGFSVLLEAGGRRVLFDTGVDARTVDNADALGVSLSGLDAIVLSHGHYDHVGGLEAVLARTGRVPVIAHPDLFRRAYVRGAQGENRYIGPPLSREQYADLGADFRDQGEPEVLGELMATVCQADGGGTPARSHQRFVREIAGGLVPDAFSEETSLVARAGGTSVVITGCAHRGAAELVHALREQGVEHGSVVLMGGLHLGAHRPDEVRRLGLRLHAMGTTRLLPCHCTGECATAVLMESFLGRVDVPGAGSVVELSTDGIVTVRHPWVPWEEGNPVHCTERT